MEDVDGNVDADVDEDGLVEDGLQDSVISRRLAAPPPWWTLRERRGDALPAQSPPGRRTAHNYVHVARF